MFIHLFYLYTVSYELTKAPFCIYFVVSPDKDLGQFYTLPVHNLELNCNFSCELREVRSYSLLKTVYINALIIENITVIIVYEI